MSLKHPIGVAEHGFIFLSSSSREFQFQSGKVRRTYWFIHRACLTGRVVGKQRMFHSGIVRVVDPQSIERHAYAPTRKGVARRAERRVTRARP